MKFLEYLVKKVKYFYMVWWLRTPRRTSSERGAAIYFAGQIANGTANTDAGDAFDFCI